MRDFAGGGVDSLDGAHQPPVAEHGDPIGQAEDFVHLVRDVKDRHAPFPQPIDHAIEPGHLGLGQGTGRLVHDEDFGGDRERFGDFDQLLIADPQAADRLPRIDLAFELLEQFAGRALHAAIVEQPQGVVPLAAEKHIGGHGKLLDQIEFLMDDAHSGLFGVARAAESHGVAVEPQLALEVRNHAGEDFHQRALARPVLAANRMEFAAGDVERHVGERDDAGEALRDAIDGDVRRLRHGRGAQGRL